jgi:hypothetical protein
MFQNFEWLGTAGVGARVSDMVGSAQCVSVCPSYHYLH